MCINCHVSMIYDPYIRIISPSFRTCSWVAIDRACIANDENCVGTYVANDERNMHANDEERVAVSPTTKRSTAPGVMSTSLRMCSLRARVHVPSHPRTTNAQCSTRITHSVVFTVYSLQFTSISQSFIS